MIVLDISPPLLMKLEVKGTLQVWNRRLTDVVLRAMYIHITTEGRLLAGSPGDPFRGRFAIHLSGKPLLQPISFCGLGSKSLCVEGLLSLMGPTPNRAWTRLNQTADAGSISLTTEEQVNWRDGDLVAIASSSYDQAHAETVPVSSVTNFGFMGSGAPTRLLTQTPLAFRHFAATETHAGRDVRMAAEVAVLNRSIEIVGVDLFEKDFFFPPAGKTFGWRARITGEAWITGVRMVGGGMFRSPKIYTPTLHLEGTSGSVVRSCTFEQMIAQPIRVSGERSVIDANVILNSVMSAIMIMNGDRVHVTNNLVLSTHCMDFCAGCCGKWNVNVGNFDIIGNAETLTFTGNSAAGGVHGLRIVTEPPGSFADNVVHSQQFGVALNLDGWAGCKPIVIKDVVLWRNWDYGICARAGCSTPSPFAIRLLLICHACCFTRCAGGHTNMCDRMTLENVVIADSKVGMTWGAVGPSSADHIIGDQKIFVSNSLFLGKSFGNAECGGDWEATLSNPSTNLAFAWWPERAQTALQLPIFTTGYVDWPGWGEYGDAYSEITYTNFMAGSYPQLFGEVRVTDTGFQRYGLPNLCGVASHVFENIPTAADANYPHLFANVTIDASSMQNISLFTPPSRTWITIDDCVAMDCDGPKHVLIHDLDGSLLGIGPNATLTSQAEFMNRYRMDGKPTIYSIPTKMLYDPAPLNIPDDPGHDVTDPGYDTWVQSGGDNRRRQLDVDTQLARGGPAESADGVEGRRLQMVFFDGDERSLYPSKGDGTSCDPDWSKFDPACRAVRRTHAETAYRGYGAYREGCTLDTSRTGWICDARAELARLVVESMDGDTETRVLVPVALASGGYVDLLNGGQDRSWAFGYSALRRLSTYFANVALGRGYDLTFTASNPSSIRLFLPSTPRASKLVISIFYSNPERLEVRDLVARRVVPEMHVNTFNFSNRKPTIDDKCGTNTYAAWENKLYVVLCGGAPGIKIVTRAEIVLSIGLTVNTEDFYDPNYLMRNIAALFGIGQHRVRIAGGSVAASRRRRQLSASNATAVDVVIDQETSCDLLACGGHSYCFEGECLCEEGWHEPEGCELGSCACSQQDCADATCETCSGGFNETCSTCGKPLPWMFQGSCVAKCGDGHFPSNSTGECEPCDTSCLTCSGGGTSTHCTSCHALGSHAYWVPPTADSTGIGIGGTCASSCPVGYHANAQRRCLACDPSCADCHGSGIKACTSCVDNTCWKHGGCPDGTRPLWQEDGSCVSSCALGFYAYEIAELGSRNCSACHESCATCLGPLETDCTTCAAGADRQGSLCQNPCPDRHFPQGGECLMCGQGCSTCDAAGKQRWGVENLTSHAIILCLMLTETTETVPPHRPLARLLTMRPAARSA